MMNWFKQKLMAFVGRYYFEIDSLRFNLLAWVALIMTCVQAILTDVSFLGFFVVFLINYIIALIAGGATCIIVDKVLLNRGYQITCDNNFITRWYNKQMKTDDDDDDDNKLGIWIPPGATMQVTVDRATGLAEYEIVEGNIK